MVYFRSHVAITHSLKFLRLRRLTLTPVDILYTQENKHGQFPLHIVINYHSNRVNTQRISVHIIFKLTAYAPVVI